MLKIHKVKEETYPLCIVTLEKSTTDPKSVISVELGFLTSCFCLFKSMLYMQVNNFSVMGDLFLAELVLSRG